MMRSITRTFPLFVTALLVAVAIVQLTVGYGDVRQASRALADKRLPLATKVLADLFQVGQQRARITALAKDPAIVTFLRSGGRTGREQADTRPQSQSQERVALHNFLRYEQTTTWRSRETPGRRELD